MTTGFPINPPRAMLTDGRGFVSPEWYRYFAQLQSAVGSSAMATWQDGYVLTGAPSWAQSLDDLAASAAIASMRVVTITANRTIEPTDALIRGNAAAGALSATLPAASTCSGRSIILKKIDGSANAVSFAAGATDTIDGSATISITTANQSYTIVSNGAGWDIV